MIFVIDLDSDIKYQLVAREADCTGQETFKGYFNDVDECAFNCKGISQMFAYGNYKGRCHGGLTSLNCKCSCKLDTINYRCKVQTTFLAREYILYRFTGEGKLLQLRFISDIFVTFKKIPHFRPTKLRAIRYHLSLIIDVLISIQGLK